MSSRGRPPAPSCPRRGYDQAEVIARRAASSAFRAARLLYRAHGTPQTGKSRRERLAGPAFRARRPRPASGCWSSTTSSPPVPPCWPPPRRCLRPACAVSQLVAVGQHPAAPGVGGRVATSGKLAGLCQGQGRPAGRLRYPHGHLRSHPPRRRGQEAQGPRGPRPRHQRARARDAGAVRRRAAGQDRRVPRAPRPTARTLDDLLLEAFAVVREAAERVHRPAPLRRAAHGRRRAALRLGRRDEDRRGQDPRRRRCRSYLNALAGQGVHLVTVNDYLATRRRRVDGPDPPLPRARPSA